MLKCLEKEPARRYSSAAALAEDLSNWLMGWPINARPIGQAERSWRWCMRNRAVAGLGTGVAVSLVLGTVVSAYFALAERRGRIRAEAAEDRVVRTFAQSLLRPLDPNGDRHPNRALSEQEVNSLWELAREGQEPIGLRVLDAAINDPLAARQICRSGRSLHWSQLSDSTQRLVIGPSIS